MAEGASAGTGLARLKMRDLKQLQRPIGFDELKSGIPARIQSHLERVLTGGGMLPPKTCAAFVNRIVELGASIRGQLARYSERREALSRFERRARENLAFQKEALGLALEISGIPKDELVDWQPVEGSQQSF